MNGSVSFFGGAFVVPADFWYYWRIIVSIGVVTLAYAVWHEKMKTFVFALIIACLLSLSGCAQMFNSTTKVHYEKRPDGTIVADYESGKEQVGLEAHLGAAPSIKVDKSSTQESVIAAALQSQIMMGEILKQLLPLVTKAASIP